GEYQPDPDQHPRGRRAAADHARLQGLCGGGRADVLRSKLPGSVSAFRRLCRQDSARDETGRPSGPAADQIRSDCEPDHGQGACPPHSSDAARARRRGDRVIRRRKADIRSSPRGAPRDACVAGTPLRGPRATACGPWIPACAGMNGIERRAFISLLGGAAVAWPLAAPPPERERVRRIGVLMSYAADDPAGQTRLLAFAQALAQLGWTEGRNMRIDIRWGAGSPERIRSYAAELVALAPDVILAVASVTTGPLLQA